MPLGWGSVDTPTPSMLPWVALRNACHGCFDSQGSKFLISELSGHWIQFSRDSNVFWVWTMLEYRFMVFCFTEKLALELESFCPMSNDPPDFV